MTAGDQLVGHDVGHHDAVAFLDDVDRERPRRTFRRIGGSLLTALLNSEDPTRDAPEVDDATPGHHDILTGEVPRDATTNPQTQRDAPHGTGAEPGPAPGDGD